uniref:hypothetical protein n=1 Tax=Pseudomonas sp. GL-B-16 TaxID=2832373 RepID=UPI001CBE5C83
QALRQQRDLRPSLTLNESLHDRPRYDLDDQKVRQSLAFSHTLDPKQPLTIGCYRSIELTNWFRFAHHRKLGAVGKTGSLARSSDPFVHP